MSSTPRVSGLKLFAACAYIVGWTVLQLWLSGDWHWIEGWLFGLWFLAVCMGCITWLYRNDPALLAERFRRPGSGDQSPADRWIIRALTLGFAAWIVVPPLDARRFGWTPPLPFWVHASGALLLLASAFFFFRSFTDNTFLSPLVRIQTERQQQVVSTGVYAFVRHPMYLGASLMFIGAPLLLGSAWGLVVGLGLVLVLVVRIRGEEALLVRELDGYAAYRDRVRYRLLPGLW
jgi:protein-S-isoprenylcysteine O-methyltransferase Ste14